MFWKLYFWLLKLVTGFLFKIIPWNYDNYNPQVEESMENKLLINNLLGIDKEVSAKNSIVCYNKN
jgi:hypothetical protein